MANSYPTAPDFGVASVRALLQLRPLKLLSQIGGCAIGEHGKSIEAIETDYQKHRKTIGIYVQTLLHDLGCRSVAAAKKQGIDASRRQSHRRE